MAAVSVISSAQPILSLLSEPDQEIQVHALKLLDAHVEQFWSEIAPSVATLESLYEDESFVHRELAAVVVSKIFFHLEELDDALKYALGAGDLFDPSAQSNFARALVAKCIDEYTRFRKEEFTREMRIAAGELDAVSSSGLKPHRGGDAMLDDEPDEQPLGSVDATAVSKRIDPRLIAIVERVFERCFADNQLEQAVGIALEACRLDVIKAAVMKSSDPPKRVTYLINIALKTIANKQFREQVLRMLVELFRDVVSKGSGSSASDVLACADCFFMLDDAEGFAQLLESLIRSSPTSDHLLAYQIAFDLTENQNTRFQKRVIEAITPGGLDSLTASAALPPAPSSGMSSAQPRSSPPASASSSPAATLPILVQSPEQKEPSAAGAVSPVAQDDDKNPESAEARLRRLCEALSGTLSADLHLHFLYSHNKTDLNILKNLKERVEAKNAIVHGAVLTANAFMHSGTTVDTFLRDHWDWLGQATNWSKFSVTASIGVIHRGHHKASQQILASFLPTPGREPTAAQGVAMNTAFQEAGALYALGLINAGVSNSQTQYLRDSLTAAGANEILKHGACLGLGLSALGSHDENVFHELHGIVLGDQAVAGEAAGYAIGLVLMGSGHAAASQELLEYAKETGREKIIRGIATALAFISYGREEAADSLIEKLVSNKDPILRVGGVLAIALAYAATGSGPALRRLLHMAVSDASDDVRRNAVTAIGFVLAHDPAQVPPLVALLCESYNPSVRFGACMALGISCAGRGLSVPDAYALLEPLLADKTDYVRQGAFIAMAMLFMLQNDTPQTGGKIATFSKLLSDSTTKKNEVMARVGACYGTGILDASGRNSVISLLSPTGHKRMIAFAGLALFTQFWFWYPLANMLCLAFHPTALIGLDSRLRKPAAWKIVCNAPPAWFDYPPKLEAKKQEVAKAKVVNVLSVAAKKKKKRGVGDDGMKDEDPSLMRSSSNALARSSSTASTAGGETPAIPRTASSASVASAAVGGAAIGSGSDVSGAPLASIASAPTVGVEGSAGETKAEKTPDTFSVLTAPCRILFGQQKYLVLGTKQRYAPLKLPLTEGFVLLEDRNPDQFFEVESAAGPQVSVPGVAEDEPPAPRPFTLLNYNPGRVVPPPPADGGNGTQ